VWHVSPAYQAHAPHVPRTYSALTPQVPGLPGSYLIVARSGAVERRVVSNRTIVAVLVIVVVAGFFYSGLRYVPGVI